MRGRFLIDIEYTDADLAAYQRVLERRLQKGADNRGWGVYATGFCVSIASSLLVFLCGAASVQGANLVAILVFAGFMLGMWSPSLWYARQRREAWRAENSRWSLLVTPSGLFTRGSGIRGFFARSTIEHCTAESGFILLWTGRQRAVAVPVRLITLEQQAELLAFADGASGSETKV